MYFISVASMKNCFLIKLKNSSTSAKVLHGSPYHKLCNHQRYLLQFLPASNKFIYQFLVQEIHYIPFLVNLLIKFQHDTCQASYACTHCMKKCVTWFGKSFISLYSSSGIFPLVKCAIPKVGELLQFALKREQLWDISISTDLLSSPLV